MSTPSTPSTPSPSPTTDAPTNAPAGTVLPALRAAFPVTVPILAGFLFLGATCGVFSSSLGLPWWAPTFMSIAIFAGSAEFVVASMLVAPFNPLQTFLTIFIVNARHLFYGLSMLDRFRDTGAKKPYLIYAMCDETFSLNFGTEPPAGIDRSWYMLWVSILDQASWVIGCTAGGVFGSTLALDVKGISFAMTALFVVIFLDQWMKDASHASAIAGVALSAGALVVCGPNGFMIPSLVLILVAVTLLRPRVEPVYERADAASGDAGEADAAGADVPAPAKEADR